MSGPPAFNDYDENGFRINKHGNRTSRTQDDSIIYNMRFKHRNELAKYSDAEVVNLYDDFFWSEFHGDNDERFLEFLKDWEAIIE